MSADVVQLADFRSLRRTSKPASQPVSEGVSANDRFLFWSGASGKRYVHTIHSLLDCPELPAANFVLVRRDAGGQRAILAIGRVTSICPGLNLAEIRQRGAQLGANEVHVHLLAQSPQEAKTVEFDLRTGQFRGGCQATAATAASVDELSRPTMH